MENSLIAACIVLLAFLLSILFVSLGLLIRRGRGTGLRGSRGQYAGFRLPYFLIGNILGQVEQVDLRHDTNVNRPPESEDK